MSNVEMWNIISQYNIFGCQNLFEYFNTVIHTFLYHKIMCLVILIPPLARLMKNLKAHVIFGNLNASRHSQILRKARQRGSTQDDENGSVLLR